MQGRRLPDVEMGAPGPGWDEWQAALRAREPGAYMKVDGSHEGTTLTYLFLIDPFGHAGSFCAERPHDGAAGNWKLTEHDDGRITVSPSIHDKSSYGPEDAHPGPGWHGYLEAGVWREC